MPRSANRTVLTTLLLAAACSLDPATGPTAPAGPPAPSFRLAIGLHPRKEGTGTLVLMHERQPSSQLTAEVMVDGLDPGTTFQVQVSVDRRIDDDCRDTNWPSLGDLTTGATGSVAAILPNAAAVLPAGASVEVVFRVVSPSGHVVLKSDCHQLQVPN